MIFRKPSICRIAFSTLLLLVASFATSQELVPEARNRRLPNLPGYEHDRLHFGFLIGFNTLDYHIYNTGARTEENKWVARYAEIEAINPGINLGIVTDLRIYNHLNLRALPGVSFGERNLTFRDEFGNKIDEKPLRIKSTFIEVPIALKYSAFRLHNIQPFILTGVTPRYDLARDKQSHLQMKSLDLYWDLSGGIDIYMYYFRLSIELKGSFGLRNIMKEGLSEEYSDRPYQQAIDALKSRIFCINFYFE
ncbi:MAG: PorT family protein [Marinilabiliaceae bacterium]|nr:PorT family protein [Marinilabiliaceae bacterium]